MRILTFAVLTALLLPSLALADEISITVYNDNFGLVKQIREMEFAKGTGETRFDDVAAQIDPTSVHIAPKDGGVSILEQNYQYDLVSAQKIMQKYLGSEIGLVIKADEKNNEVRRGELLSFDGAFIILRTSSGEITITNPAHVIDCQFGKLPEGLILKPTLVWRTEADRNIKTPCEVSYLTNGINWHAEYVAVVDNDDKNLSLSGWVSIDNQSGATYKDATLKLVAGKVNRIVPRPPMPLMEERMSYDMAAAAPQFQEESFFEYHLYSLTRKATVADKETKQLTLFPEAKTAATKTYTVEAATQGYYGDQQNKLKVKIGLEFTNSKEAGLGMPLPKGKLRVYKADTKGELQFVGEDQIDHTPKDEKVRVFLGEAFDVTCERNKTNVVDLGASHARETYEIKLKNHKDSDITVTVVEPMPGYREWNIAKSNIEFKKVNAYKTEFQAPVKANGENTLMYTIEY